MTQGPSGFLRDSATLVETDGEVVIRYALWELSLPRDWVVTHVGLRRFLDRQLGCEEIGDGDPQVRNVILALALQGCLTADGGRDNYSLRDVRELFRPLCYQWYGQYYSHPLWNRLREGTLSQNGLVAWMIHNYHVSRSVGMTDARCAVRLPRP